VARLLASLLLAAVFLLADTKTVTKYSSNCCISVNTEYIQGEKVRREINVERSSRRSGKFHQATINTDRQIEYELDFKSGEYMERAVQARSPVNNSPPTTAPPPRLPPAVASNARPVPGDSGKTLDWYEETIDTGETKELFGKTVKHLILRTRRVAEAGACEPSRTTQREGWYVVEPEAPRGSHFRLIGGFGAMRDGQPCHDRLKFHGEFPKVHAMVETDESGNKLEVLELSNAPLDPKLFELPAGFRKVDKFSEQQLSWEDRLADEFDALTREIASWFR
jgi:hypothetical protein